MNERASVGEKRVIEDPLVLAEASSCRAAQGLSYARQDRDKARIVPELPCHVIGKECRDSEYHMSILLYNNRMSNGITHSEWEEVALV